MHVSMPYMCQRHMHVLPYACVAICCLCETCNLVEDEIHVLLHCSMYDDIRDTLFADICNIKRDFCDLTVDSQFILIMSDPQYFKFVSKAMYCILNRRRCATLR